MPTRYKEIGLAGRKFSSQRSDAGISDPYLRQYVIDLPLVASAAEQTVPGFTMPANAISAVGFLRIRSASTGGAAQTISVGALAGGPTDLINAQATTAAGIFASTQGVDLSGDQITYTLGSADITGLEAELVLTVMGSND